MAYRKTILITGASSGLGAAMARHYAERGHHLALCARRLEALESLRESLLAENSGIKIELSKLDVCDHEQVFSEFRRLRAALGSLDRVIVNAGMGKGASPGTGYFTANRRTVETNFVAALAQCEAALEIFREQQSGHLVTMSSMAALRGMPGAFAAYTSSKAGLRVLSEGIRADLRGSPIKVSCIMPGFILTPINEDMRSAPFRVDLDTGVRAIVRAISREPGEAWVPAWPWLPVGWLLRLLPAAALAKMR